MEATLPAVAQRNFLDISTSACLLSIAVSSMQHPAAMGLQALSYQAQLAAESHLHVGHMPHRSDRTACSFAAPSNAEAERAAQNAAKVDAALASAPRSIRDAAYTIGSQQHFYMEPQVHLPPGSTVISYVSQY